MSSEAANVEILREAYGKWHETKGGSLNHFLGFIDPQISFGSVPRGAAPLTFAKQYDNREAMKAYFDGLLTDWTMVHYTIERGRARVDGVGQQEDRKEGGDAKGRFLALPRRQGGRILRIF